MQVASHALLKTSVLSLFKIFFRIIDGLEFHNCIYSNRAVLSCRSLWPEFTIFPNNQNKWKITLGSSKFLVYLYFCNRVYIRSSVGWMNQTESKTTWSKFHGESTDNLFIYNGVDTQCNVQQLWWHFSLEVWFIYSNVCCCICKACIQVRMSVDFNQSVLNNNLLSLD